MRYQVLYANDFLFGEAFTTRPLALTDIANFLGMYSDSTVGKTLKNRHRNANPKFKGMIGVPEEDEIAEISGWIETSLENHNPLTPKAVMKRIRVQMHKTINEDALKKLLQRRRIAKTIQAKPEEAGRLNIDPEAIAKYRRKAAELIQDVPAALVFNMDESGMGPLHFRHVTKPRIHISAMYGFNTILPLLFATLLDF